ncbi:ras gtpase-activating protein [Anaeramoeba flamelloides]|uniref:Ras gtpase-activating protein n=1 Tax=Anaeramoeba flamelloides TaxID=1746091 RepID=A0ABQ8XWS1_9EUKA|nr:ras gtpase-activating protein [Anaeramoeba flamelloides]
MKDSKLSLLSTKANRLDESLFFIKNNKSVTNLSTDLKDCTLLFATLLLVITQNEKFFQVSQISDPYQRAELFCEIFDTLGFSFDSPSSQQIIDGERYEILIFICKLFLYQRKNKKSKKTKLKEKKKIKNQNQRQIPQNQQQQQQLQQNKEEEGQKQEQNLINLKQIETSTQTENKTHKEKKDTKEIFFKNQDLQKQDLSINDPKKTLIKEKEEKQNQPLSPPIEMFAKVGSQMIRSLSNHNQKILDSLLNVAKIVPELSQDTKYLKQELFNLRPISLLKNEELNSTIIFEQTFFKILKSYGHNLFDFELQKLLTRKINQIKIVDEKVMSQFLEEILQILEDNNIISGVLSELEKSIISLVDQFFFSHIFKSRLTNLILKVFLSKNFFTMSVDSSNSDQLYKIIFKSLDQFIPGIVDINLTQQAIKYLFQYSFIEETINESVREKIFAEALKEAFGRSISFIIDRLFGNEFEKEINNFFEDATKGEKRKQLYYDIIFPETRMALKDFLSNKDANNLIFSVESSICKENSKEYSMILFSFLATTGLILPFIKVSIIAEVYKVSTSGALFRSNDVNQKVIHHYIDLIGAEYLKKTLESILTEMQNADYSYEIDSFSISEDEKLEDNLQIVIKYFHQLVQAVFNSVQDAPLEMRVICNYYRELTKLKYPEKVLQTIGGFIFLRFFCPGMVAPYQRGIVKEPINMKLRRGLLLISSAIQALSNGISFSEMRLHMRPFNDLIIDYLPSREKFLFEISNIDGINEKQLFVPYSNRLKLKDLKYTKIRSVHVSKIFKAPENISIPPNEFAMKLLIDCQKYSNWKPKEFRNLYSSIIFNRLNQVNNSVTQRDIIFSPLKEIFEKIIENKEDENKIENENEKNVLLNQPNSPKQTRKKKKKKSISFKF